MNSQACTSCNQPVEPGDVQCSLCGRDLDTVGPETIPHRGGGAAAQHVARSSPAPAILVAIVAIVAIAAIAGLTLLRSTPGGGAVTSAASRLGQSAGPDANTDSTSTAPSKDATAGSTTSSSSATPSAPTASFSELYKSAADGVVRIETTACSDGGVGSGFLLAPDLVATVAHVVDGSASIVLRQGSTTTTGTVVGFDRSTELALVRASTPMSGHVFTLASSQPEVGTDIAAIGYPLAGPESLTKGAISGLDRPVQTATASLTGLLQTDAPIDPGNSGGPLLLADGTVVGIVDAKSTDGANIGFAIPAATASGQLQGWQQAPTPVRLAGQCAAPVGPSSAGSVVTDTSGSPDGPALLQTFDTYTSGINRGNYPAAYAVLSPTGQRRTSYAQFSSGTQSSYIVALQITGVSAAAGAGKDNVEVSFTSLQDAVRGGTGQTCSQWQMTYTMLPATTGWLIDNAAPHRGSPAAC